MLVMVVEDEALLALDVAQIIEDSGHRVLGPFYSLREATRGLEDGTPDLGLLDFQLGDGTSAPLADTLVARGTPVVFMSGNLRRNLPRRFDEIPLLTKPVLTSSICSLLTDLSAVPMPGR